MPVQQPECSFGDCARNPVSPEGDDTAVFTTILGKMATACWVSTTLMAEFFPKRREDVHNKTEERVGRLVQVHFVGTVRVILDGLTRLVDALDAPMEMSDRKGVRDHLLEGSWLDEGVRRSHFRAMEASPAWAVILKKQAAFTPARAYRWNIRVTDDKEEGERGVRLASWSVSGNVVREWSNVIAQFSSSSSSSSDTETRDHCHAARKRFVVVALRAHYLFNVVSRPYQFYEHRGVMPFLSDKHVLCESFRHPSSPPFHRRRGVLFSSVRKILEKMDTYSAGRLILREVPQIDDACDEYEYEYLSSSSSAEECHCCTVCYRDLSDMSHIDVKSTPCGHLFCWTCLQTWAMKNTNSTIPVAPSSGGKRSSPAYFSCPMCRERITSKRQGKGALGPDASSSPSLQRRHGTTHRRTLQRTV
jgi:hypothetical protein